MFLFLIYFIELYEFEEDGVKNIYWSVNYPWPMSNRDVSFSTLHLWCMQIIPWSVFNTNIRPVAYITKCQIKIELKDCLIFKDLG